MPSGVAQNLTDIRVNGKNGALNAVNDAVAGGQPESITSYARYAVQAGARVVLDQAALGGSAQALYGGWYQYVQCLLGVTLAPATGIACFWNDFEKYIVDTDYTAVKVGKIAGFFLNAVSKGNWGFIQTKGKATVLFGTIAKATPADGDLVIVNTGSIGDIPSSGDSTTMTALLTKQAIGVALAAPVSSAASLVLLRWMPDVI